MGVNRDTKTLQTFYNLYGYSKQAIGTTLAVDGIPGTVTQKVIKYFQTAKKIVVDGIPGPQTWKEIIKVIQKDLNDKGISKLAIGANLTVDGVDGPVTEKVIVKLQDLKGLKQDKILGIVTLTTLAYYNSTSDNIGATGWARIIYTRDSQDTNYTCGPSSLKMALSVYGYNYSETTLTTLVGAKPKVGTSIEGIVNAVNNLGKGLKARNETFKDWETLRGYLAKGYPVILRIASYLTPGGEHYVLLCGLNVQTGQVELGDPSNGGFRATTTTDLLNRIKQVSVASVIVISK
jgi:peptidoglycan hydrolase-like protein with peptidoglycan-binding domain